MKRRGKQTAEDRSTRGKVNLESTGIHVRIDPTMQRLRLFHVVENSGRSLNGNAIPSCGIHTHNVTPSKYEAKPSTLGKTEDKTGKVEISDIQHANQNSKKI